MDQHTYLWGGDYIAAHTPPPQWMRDAEILNGWRTAIANGEMDAPTGKAVGWMDALGLPDRSDDDRLADAEAKERRDAMRRFHASSGSAIAGIPCMEGGRRVGWLVRYRPADGLQSVRARRMRDAKLRAIAWKALDAHGIADADRVDECVQLAEMRSVEIAAALLDQETRGIADPVIRCGNREYRPARTTLHRWRRVVRMIKNAARRMATDRVRSIANMQSAATRGTGDTVAVIQHDSQRDALAAIAGLSGIAGTVARRYFVGGETLRGIADDLGISYRAVLNHRNAARASLAASLAEYAPAPSPRPTKYRRNRRQSAVDIAVGREMDRIQRRASKR